MQELSALITIAIENHPFICNIKYAFQDNSFLYLILELASCGDLRANLRRARGNRVPESVAQFIIAQVAVAVEYCHSKCILHRGKCIRTYLCCMLCELYVCMHVCIYIYTLYTVYLCDIHLCCVRTTCAWISHIVSHISTIYYSISSYVYICIHIPYTIQQT